MVCLTLCELCGHSSILFHKHFTYYNCYVGGYYSTHVEVRGQFQESLL